MNLIEWIASSRFLRFAVVGGTGFIVNEAVLYLIHEVFAVEPYAAGVLAFAVTVTYTWMGNRFLTFRDKAAHGARAMLQEWVKFVGANMIGFVVNYSTYIALITFAHPPLNNPYIALACGTLAGMLFNFTLSEKLVFRV
ncbi:MAG TPA: GtrA family protein [Rhizomicrobium sp.]|nr:GtrA family protein [Rhizomicrobium sp.]